MGGQEDVSAIVGGCCCYAVLVRVTNCGEDLVDRRLLPWPLQGNLGDTAATAPCCSCHRLLLGPLLDEPRWALLRAFPSHDDK